jgi:hypothetical protein
MYSEHYINITQRHDMILYSQILKEWQRKCVHRQHTGNMDKTVDALQNNKAPGTDIINLELLNKHNIGLWYFTYKTI